MRLTGKTRRQLSYQNWLYYILVVVIAGCIAWLSVRFPLHLDVSANSRNSLNSASLAILEKMQKTPIEFIIFVDEKNALRTTINDMIARYQQQSDLVEIEFINPQTNPKLAHEYNVTTMGEVIIKYNEKFESVTKLSEQSITNALQRLSREEALWIAFLTGHGERDPHNEQPAGYANFSKSLEKTGFNVLTLNMLEQTQIPDNVHVLVLASPRKELLPGELTMLLDYVDRGGNLLWLTEPETKFSLTQLENKIGVNILPGTVVDAAGQNFGINRPDFVLIVKYPHDEIMKDFTEYTIFPQTSAVTIQDPAPMDSSDIKPLLQTMERSWNEMGDLSGDVLEYNQEVGEKLGPLYIGATVWRIMPRPPEDVGIDKPPPIQRIAVIGDGDFLSNAFIGEGGNAAFGMAVINWLSHEDDYIPIDAVSAPDVKITISDSYHYFISFIFLILIPIALALTGVIIWFKRRKR